MAIQDIANVMSFLYITIYLISNFLFYLFIFFGVAFGVKPFKKKLYYNICKHKP